jgi:hypothetical protein
MFAHAASGFTLVLTLTLIPMPVRVPRAVRHRPTFGMAQGRSTAGRVGGWGRAISFRAEEVRTGLSTDRNISIDSIL